MACSMAFFWADEPSAFSVPVGQLEAAVVDPPVVAADVGALLLEPQADRASVPTRATPVMLANRRRDWVFKVFGPLHSRDQNGVRWRPPGSRLWRQNDGPHGGGLTDHEGRATLSLWFR